MSELTQLVYRRMADDSELAGLIETYPAGESGGTPAVFTSRTVPEDAELPYILTTGNVTQVPFESKQLRGWEVTRDIGCYAKDLGSDALVEQIAERVRALFHRQSLAIGAGAIIAFCVGPFVAPTGDGVTGRIVQVTWKYFES